MNKYKSKSDGRIAIIISDRAAGMGDKVLGITMVVYRYEGDTHDYPFIMEYKEFYRDHIEITK